MLTNFPHRLGETDISLAQGLELEVEDYLEKPVNPQELLHRVEKIIQKK